MAYVDFTQPAPVLTSMSAPRAPRAEARFSALEWQVVALAERDSLASLRRPGRLAVALGNLFGTARNPRLADPRLEALRRLAVLSWRYGYVVPGHEVRAFVEAGFTPDHQELLIDSIAEARAARRLAA